MRDKLIPAVGIVVVTIILIAVNELTDSTLIQDYAFLFIVAGMLLGVLLARLSAASKDKKK